MNPQPISYYAHQVRAALPPSIFAPERNRLWWLLLHVTLATTGIVGVALGWGGILGALGLSLVIGHSFAGMAFVGHETLHGAVVRSSGWRYLIGALCFLPFMVPARIWIAWHNRVHHGNTGRVGIDPDAYPTLAQFRASATTRAADHVAFGSRRWLGIITLLTGFFLQSMQIMWLQSRQRGYLTPRQHNRAIVEWVLAAAVWTGLAFLIGGTAFIFAFVIPLMLGNMIVISYILTNHSLSPLNDVNDPLLNSLSVTAPRVIEWLHLDFGYHVEHHLFPAMSSAHAREVRDVLVAKWPERYQTLPLFRALWLLFSTPRVYYDATTLVDPRTGRRFATLQPGHPAPQPEAAEPAPAPPLLDVVEA